MLRSIWRASMILLRNYEWVDYFILVMNWRLECKECNPFLERHIKKSQNGHLSLCKLVVLFHQIFVILIRKTYLWKTYVKSPDAFFSGGDFLKRHAALLQKFHVFSFNSRRRDRHWFNKHVEYSSSFSFKFDANLVNIFWECKRLVSLYVARNEIRN